MRRVVERRDELHDFVVTRIGNIAAAYDGSRLVLARAFREVK